MFTGIVSDIGTVAARDRTKLKIASHYDPASVALGASIACDGCCLTVTRIKEGADGGAMFEVDVSNETAARTTLGSWKQGTRINLERSLSFGSELGGHLMTGHIDGVARVKEMTEDDDSVRFVFDAPAEFAPFIAAKGSVALNGVSLTVNEVDGTRFGVNIIPYTLAHTTWGDRKPGDLINLEVDLLARYVERIAAGRLAASRAMSEQDR
ncbi:riboflavin synthase [Methyloceanibacter sp.]|uniref:riboflavin synthase n=1 Tax=Methyloceanibacter sp. TaxID=1965321 RepID=UPI003D6D4B1D